MAKLTKRSVEALEPEAKDYFVWDSQIAGFGVRIMPSAAKTYQAQYRKGGRTRRVSAGRHGKVTVDEARKLAKEIMGQVAKGENSAEEISQHRKAPTVAAFCERFNAHTGDHGAVWLFQDPEDRIPNNPGITVDFRAFGLATGGLDHAEQHFRDCMTAFGIPYVETQQRVARADFAVDFLAPLVRARPRSFGSPTRNQDHRIHRNCRYRDNGQRRTRCRIARGCRGEPAIGDL